MQRLNLTLALGLGGFISLIVTLPSVHAQDPKPQPIPVPQPSAQLVRFEIAPPAGGAIQSPPQISPDGRTLAYIASTPGRPGVIRVRPLSEAGERVALLPGTEGAIGLFWSPDGLSLGFSHSGR